MAKSGGPARYFIMRSNSSANLFISVEESAWATQKHNEARLNEAFAEGPVRLFYSVNSSGSFQGYATMHGRVGELGRRVIWESGQTFGVSLGVEWNCLFDLSFGDVEHLRNSMNENKPVKIARDGQEVPTDLGDQLVALMEAKAKAGGAKPPKVQVQLMKMQSDHQQHNNNSNNGGGGRHNNRDRGGGDRQDGFGGPGGGRHQQHGGNGRGMDGRGHPQGGMMGPRGMDLPFMGDNGMGGPMGGGMGGAMGGGMGGMGGMDPLLAMAMGNPMMAGMMAGMMQGAPMGMGMNAFPAMGGFPMSMPGVGQMGGMGQLGMGGMGAMAGMGAMSPGMGGMGQDESVIAALLGRGGLAQSSMMQQPGSQLQQRGLGMLPPASAGLSGMIGLPGMQQPLIRQPAPPPRGMQMPGLPNSASLQQMNGLHMGSLSAMQQQLPSVADQHLLQQQRLMQVNGILPAADMMMGGLPLPSERRVPSERSSRRSRSRSRSPGRGSSRRGRSRERVRSRERSRDRSSRSPRRGENSSILDMSYDEYLDHYRKNMHRSKEISTSAARRPDSPPRRSAGHASASAAAGGLMMQQGGGLGMGMSSVPGNVSHMNGSNASAPASAPQAASQPATYTEEQYIQLTTDMYLSKGAAPPSVGFIRDYYRRMLAQSQ